MRPTLPNKASHDIDRITARTWNQLLECISYAMDHPRGDGVTVLNDGAGILSACRKGGSAASAASTVEIYDGPFAITVDDGKIKVKGGLIYLGNQSFSVPDYEFDVPSGCRSIWVWLDYHTSDGTDGSFSYGIMDTDIYESPTVSERLWYNRIGFYWENGSISQEINGNVTVTGRYV